MIPDSQPRAGEAPASPSAEPPTGRSLGQGGGRGLTARQRAQTVEELFAAFPWEPTPHAALSRWDTQAFFSRFLK